MILGDYYGPDVAVRDIYPDQDGIQAVRLEGTQTYVFTGQATVKDAWGHAPILTGRFQVAWEDWKQFTSAMDKANSGDSLK